jgi:tetratricopeptide (TPR) repeat protein
MVDYDVKMIDLENVKELINRGDQCYANKRYNEALELFNKAFEINPKYTQVLHCRSKTLYQLERYNESLDSIEKALEVDDNNPQYLICKGRILYNMRRFEDAATFYNRILEINPRNLKALEWLSEALYRLKNFDETLSIINQYLEIDSENFEAWKSHAFVLETLGRFEEAIESYDKALAIKPDDLDTWRKRAHSLYKLGRCEEAIEFYDKALAINPDDPDIWCDRAFLLEDCGLYEKAIESYDKALAIKPENSDIWLHRAFLQEDYGQYEEATVSFDKSIANTPNEDIDKADLWSWRGDCLYKLERYDDAVISYKKAVDINPTVEEGYIIDLKITLNKVKEKKERDKGVNLNDYSRLSYPNQQSCFICSKKNSIYIENLTDDWKARPDKEHLPRFICDDCYERILTRKKDLENEKQNELRRRRILIANQFSKTKDYAYIQKFVKIYKSNTDEKRISDLFSILKNRNFEGDIECLNLLIQEEIEKRENEQNYSKFIQQITFNNPQTFEGYLHNFLIFLRLTDETDVKYFPYLIEFFKTKGIQVSQNDLRNELDAIRIKEFEDDLLSGCTQNFIKIDDIDSLSGYAFELLIKKLFECKGYFVEITPKTRDQGADLIAKGQGERIAIQVKNHKENVGNGAIQEVVASIKHYQANRGLVISSSGFTISAIELANSNKIELWDRDILCKYLDMYKIELE